MTNAASATISLPFNQVIPLIHCPVCGWKLDVSEDDNPCPHVLYAHMEEFFILSDELQAHVDYYYGCDEDLDQDDVIEYLNSKLEDDHILKLSIVGAGMACGPVSYTLNVAFDFSKAPQDGC